MERLQDRRKPSLEVDGAEPSLVRDSCGTESDPDSRCGQVSPVNSTSRGRLGSHLNNLDPMGQQACPTHLGHPAQMTNTPDVTSRNASMSSLPSNDALSSENLRQFHISCCLLALKRLLKPGFQLSSLKPSYDPFWSHHCP